MTDVTMGWGLAVAGLLGLVVLVVVAVRQILQRYSDRVVIAGWIAVVVLYPIGGAASWFLWESWLRDVVRSRKSVAHR